MPSHLHVVPARPVTPSNTITITIELPPHWDLAQLLQIARTHLVTPQETLLPVPAPAPTPVSSPVTLPDRASYPALPLPKLARLRHSAHLTQRELAALAGLSTKTIMGVECGRRAQYETAVKLASALHTTVEALRCSKKQRG